MDKTLEIVLVAVVLVVAAVIVVGLLQGQAGGFGSFADNQTGTAGCGVAKSQFCMAYSGSGPPTGRADGICQDNTNCAWAGTCSSGDAPFGCSSGSGGGGGGGGGTCSPPCTGSDICVSGSCVSP